jgi:DUF917 family protein
MRELTTEAVEDIAIGAAVLGTGGGGDPYIGKLMAKDAIEEHGPVELLDPNEVPDDALVVPSAMVGAPTVIQEKLPRGTEAVETFRALERHVNEEAYATMGLEAGGLNSTIPLGVAATLDLPIIDADGIGRAFPATSMTTLSLGGIDATPMTIADERGNSLLLEAIDNEWSERFSRTISSEMGGTATTAMYSHTGAETKEHTIHGSLSYAEEIGQTIRGLDDTDAAPVNVLADQFDGHHLFYGKITDVLRRTSEGHVDGYTTIEGLDVFSGHELTLRFQNEFLIAETGTEVLSTVPDLICVIESETGSPVTTEDLKYGYRVDVLGLPCADPWRTEAGLELGGPAFFDYDVPYIPIEQRAADSDIIDP